MRRAVSTLAALLCALVLSAGCGDDGGSETASPESDTGPTVIDVTFEGDTVTPNGERVEVPVGEKVIVQLEVR